MLISCRDENWNTYLNRFPICKRDIYYTREYYCLEEKEGISEGVLFVYEEEDNLGIYPFLKHDVSFYNQTVQCYDIESAYGYGGPLVLVEDVEFERRFEEAFLQLCKSENIVAEFVRFHPLLGNEKIFEAGIQVLHNRTTVWLDLSKDLDAIWMSDIATQNRNIIRKCQKNGLSVEISNDYDEFQEIYNETMDKVGAGDFYYFQQDYYEHMKNDNHYVLLRVRMEEQTIAAAIFMMYGECFHYHLSGSRQEYLKLSPNNVLLWEAIKYAKSHGYKKMHFGGGLTDSPEDTLFRFKKKFSSETADFYIGKRVHNPEVYQCLIHDWEQKQGQKATMLLQYHMN